MKSTESSTPPACFLGVGFTHVRFYLSEELRVNKVATLLVRMESVCEERIFACEAGAGSMFSRFKRASFMMAVLALVLKGRTLNVF